MFETKAAHKVKIYIPNKKGRLKKHGSVRNVVFHPAKPVAVGYIVKRPDLLWMIKRKDRFVALDSVIVDEEGTHYVMRDNDDAWDRRACKRLDIDFDLCVLWDNMPVRTADGVEVGLISNVVFDEASGKVDHIELGEGSINRAILGHAEVGVESIKGYVDGAILVDVDSADVQIAGGVAEKAGEAWGKTSAAASEMQANTTEAAAQAIEKGAYKTGEALGSVKDKIKESGVTEKAGKAINDGAFKLGQAIGNLTRDDEEDDNAPVQVKAHISDGSVSDGEAAAAAKTAEQKEKAQAAKKKAAEEDAAYDAAAKKVGEQLGKTKGMFRAFKDEFDKASKGE